MATVNFYVATDMAASLPLANLPEVQILSTSPTEIRGGTPAGVLQVILSGQFSFDAQGYLIDGTLTGWTTYLADGIGKASQVTGLSTNVIDLYDHVMAGTYDTLVQSMFSGNDKFTGSSGADALLGYAGNDTIDGGAGNDTMTGGDGSDGYYVRESGDKVVETNATASSGGTDIVYSYLASYTLGANVENGLINISAAADLTGNSLNNLLYAGTGNNKLDGSGGTDTVDYSRATSAVTVSLALTTGQATGGSGTDTLLGIENLNGSAYNDKLTGGSGNNSLYGAAGNDVLDGGAGNDSMTGGDGSDAYYLRDSGDKIVETNATASSGGTDIVYSYLASYTLGANVENGLINISTAADLTGNELNNLLYAGSGNNKLNGNGGTDTVDYRDATSAVTVSLALTTGQVTGGSGTDTLTSIENLSGSAYNDMLTGSSGSNMLNGAAGNDVLTGGTGADTFRFSTTPSATTNVDTISDFHAVDDSMQFENGIYTKLVTTGALPAANFVANTNGLAVDSNDYLVYETDTGKLFYDADGSGAGAAVLVATLTGAPALSSADIFVT